MDTSSLLTPDYQLSDRQSSTSASSGNGSGGSGTISGSGSGVIVFDDLCDESAISSYSSTSGSDAYSGDDTLSSGGSSVGTSGVSSDEWLDSSGRWKDLKMQPDTSTSGSTLAKEPVICPHVSKCAMINSCSSGSSSTCKSCYRDSVCVEYGDCCVDYEHLAPPGDHRHQFECVNIHPRFNSKAPERNVKVISSCPPSQEADADTVSKCTASNGLLPPATDLSTNLTYKNIHCALCHATSEAVVWSYQLLCPNNETFTLMNVSQLMENCQGIDFLEPQPSIIHECCSGDMIAACPSYENSDYYHTAVSLAQYCSWVGKCYKYQRPVKSGDVMYKNESCALCGGVINSTMEECNSICMFVQLFPVIGGIYDEYIYPLYIEFDGLPILDIPTPSNRSQYVECNASMDESTFDYYVNNTVLFEEEAYKIVLNATQGHPVICVQNKSVLSRYAYPAGYDIITYVGSSLSMIGCVLILLTICLFKNLRTLPSSRGPPSCVWRWCTCSI